MLARVTERADLHGGGGDFGVAEALAAEELSEEGSASRTCR